MKNYKEAWFILKNRLEHFLWALEQDNENQQRAYDTRVILQKMNELENKIE